jgi:cystathionine beta-lyase
MEWQDRSLAANQQRLEQLFGTSDLLPLWIAEPYVDPAPPIASALTDRAMEGWYGYEARPSSAIDAFWGWMRRRHGWSVDDLSTLVSPSIGTSIAVAIDLFSEPGDGVILQPPVFTDFKPLVVRAERRVVKNPLVGDGTYRMDHDDLARVASDPTTKLLILCNPHNPVGRSWTADELRAVAQICAANDVLVVADEIHADLTLPSHTFTPFASAARGTSVRWAATHGPIKTFGLAGVCDTLLITDNDEIATTFRRVSSRFHLTRSNVFSLAAFEAAYREGDAWFDDFLGSIAHNAETLRRGLPYPVGMAPLEATYLAWLDLTGLGLDVPELSQWLVDAGLALSPGHWFGREGAGHARMTIAVPEEVIQEAVVRLTEAVAG